MRFVRFFIEAEFFGRANQKEKICLNRLNNAASKEKRVYNFLNIEVDFCQKYHVC